VFVEGQFCPSFVLPPYILHNAMRIYMVLCLATRPGGQNYSFLAGNKEIELSPVYENLSLWSQCEIFKRL